jgi:glycosyltransferase involved in cell wall biosynthesis
MALERVVYGGRKVTLTAVSTKVARELAQHYGWTLEWGREAAAFNAMGISHPLSGRVQLTEGMAAASRPQSEGGGVVPPIPVIFHGIDPGRFNPETRARRRAGARATLGMGEDEFCLLLVGNDWKNKGLPTLLGSLDRLREPRVRLLVVGQDTVEPYRKMIDRLGLGRRVTFRSPRPDVEFYYAAADLYAGPSLEDAFGLPPLEAMACGLPVITSAQAGVSEVITEGVDGFVIDNPQDSAKLSDLIALLYQNQDLRKRVGEAAALTAKQYSWDRNARELGQVFQEVLRRRNSLVNGMQGTLGGAPDTRAEARVGQNVQ